MGWELPVLAWRGTGTGMGQDLDGTGATYVNIIDNDITIDNVSTIDINKLINIYCNTGLRY